MNAGWHFVVTATAALLMSSTMTAAPLAGQVEPGVPQSPEGGPFRRPWSDESTAAMKPQVESMIVHLNRWRSPGLDQVEFEGLLDEMGVPRADAARRELLTLWEAHRARMISLYSSTTGEMWAAAEEMTPEWTKDRWSKSMRRKSETQGQRIADAQLRSIDDVQQLLLDVVSRLTPAQREQAEFVRARTIDRLLREDELIPAVRAGGTRADLEQLVRKAARQIDDDAWGPTRAVLQQYFSQTEPARRELVRAGWRTSSLRHYVKVPDEQALREVRSELLSPQFGQSATLIRDALARAVVELEAILGMETKARLTALLDAEASPPPSFPDAAFPDRQQGELLCQLLAIAPPALAEESAELLRVAETTTCAELAVIKIGRAHV